MPDAAGSPGYTPAGKLSKKMLFSLTPYTSDIDLSTKEGKKDYAEMTAKLSATFDGNHGSTHEWMTAFKDRVDERGLRASFLIEVNGKKIDLITQPGLVPMSNLLKHCESIWADEGLYQHQLCHQMVGILLRKSVTAIIRERLEQEKHMWYIPAKDGICGLIIFKRLMEYCGKTSKYGIDALKTKLMELTLKQFKDQNISLALQHRNKLKDELIAQGEGVHEDLFLLMRLLKSCTVAKFITYIDGLENAYEDGTLVLTASDLAFRGENKYKTLVEQGQWKTTGDVGQQLVAMHTVIKSLTTGGGKATVPPKSTGNNQPKPVDPTKPAKDSKKRHKSDIAWKYENADGAKNLVKDGKTFNWCTGNGGTHHAAMWSVHEPNTCTAQQAGANKGKSDERNTAKGSEKGSKAKAGAPKLQPNKKFQAALLALDNSFKSGADSDDESQKHE